MTRLIMDQTQEGLQKVFHRRNVKSEKPSQAQHDAANAERYRKGGGVYDDLTGLSAGRVLRASPARLMRPSLRCDEFPGLQIDSTCVGR